MSFYVCRYFSPVLISIPVKGENGVNPKTRSRVVELLTRHFNLQYKLHKMRRAKTPSCRCGAEKETLVHILCECPKLEKIRMQTLGFVRMDPDQIKEARLSNIVPLGKGSGLLNKI